MISNQKFTKKTLDSQYIFNRNCKIGKGGWTLSNGQVNKSMRGRQWRVLICFYIKEFVLYWWTTKLVVLIILVVKYSDFKSFENRSEQFIE